MCVSEWTCVCLCSNSTAAHRQGSTWPLAMVSLFLLTSWKHSLVNMCCVYLHTSSTYTGPGPVLGWSEKAECLPAKPLHSSVWFPEIFCPSSSSSVSVALWWWEDNKTSLMLNIYFPHKDSKIISIVMQSCRWNIRKVIEKSQNVRNINYTTLASLNSARLYIRVWNFCMHRKSNEE